MTEQQFDDLMDLLSESHNKRLDAILSEHGKYTESGYDSAARPYSNECESYCSLIDTLEDTFGFTSKV